MHDCVDTSVGDGSCKVTVDIDGAPMLSRWYDIWADAVAITGICLASGKWGMSKTLGMFAGALPDSQERG